MQYRQDIWSRFIQPTWLQHQSIEIHHPKKTLKCHLASTKRGWPFKELLFFSKNTSSFCLAKKSSNLQRPAFPPTPETLPPLSPRSGPQPSGRSTCIRPMAALMVFFVGMFFRGKRSNTFLQSALLNHPPQKFTVRWTHLRIKQAPKYVSTKVSYAQMWNVRTPSQKSKNTPKKKRSCRKRPWLSIFPAVNCVNDYTLED